MELKTIIESLIFASDKPLTLKQLKALTGNTKAELVKRALDDITSEFQSSGIQLVEVGGGFQFRTHPDAAVWVKRLLAGRPPRLTQAMLETLAIIAYRQPITRPEIEDIRGVDCGGVIRLLLERSLCRILGKKEEPGRPILYGTTRQFLEFFNLKDLSALPTLKEFTELSEEMAGELEVFDDGNGPPEAEPGPEAASLAGAPEPAPAEAAGADPGPGEPVPAARTVEDLGEPVPELSPENLGEPLPGDHAIDSATAPESTEEASLECPEPATPEGARTWTRAAAGAVVDEDLEDDAALAALDRAMERVQGVLRNQQQAERERLKALLDQTGAAEPVPGMPPVATREPPITLTEDLPELEESEDRPPEEL
jgi:segregation and condensation protein B